MTNQVDQDIQDMRVSFLFIENLVRSIASAIKKSLPPEALPLFTAAWGNVHSELLLELNKGRNNADKDQDS